MEDAGALAVREFSSFESCGAEVKKAVFLISGPVAGIKRDVLKEIVTSSKFEYCQVSLRLFSSRSLYLSDVLFNKVITSASPAVHRSWSILCESVSGDEKVVFEELEQSVLEWMGDANFTSEVFHLPFHSASLSEDLFVTTASGGLCSLLEPDVQRAYELWAKRSKSQEQQQQQQQNQTDAGRRVFFNLLPPQLQVCVHDLVASLHSLLQMTNVAEDIFTVGSFSRLVGEQLEAWQPARNRRKAAENKISLVLVDRTLDLAGPTSSSPDTMLGQLRAHLPAFPGLASDSAVDMTSFFGINDDRGSADACPMGCLCGPSLPSQVEQNRSAIGDLMTKDESSLISGYCDRLRRALDVQEGGESSLPSLCDLLTTFAGSQDAGIDGNLDLLTKARALTLLQGSQMSKRRAKMSEVEARNVRAWHKSSKEGRGFLVQLSKLVRERRDRGLTLENLLVLLTHCYALLPPEEDYYPEDEDRLQSALSEAIVKDRHNLGPTFEAMVGDEDVDELAAFRAVKKVFARLHAIKAARAQLKSYHSVMEGGRYCGLLEQLLRDIFAEDRRDVPDLEYRAGGLGGLLKSGIGLFGVSVNRTHPRENPSLWVYVIGGVTADEVKVCKDIAAAKSSRCQVVVGGTKLLSPSETIDSLFVQDPLCASE